MLYCTSCNAAHHLTALCFTEEPKHYTIAHCDICGSNLGPFYTSSEFDVVHALAYRAMMLATRVEVQAQHLEKLELDVADLKLMLEQRNASPLLQFNSPSIGVVP
jgi:hypothetical protein